MVIQQASRINEEILVAHVEYFKDNIYTGNRVYRQCIEIPHCTPLVTNLSLSHYE